MAKLIYEYEEVDDNDNPTGKPSEWDYSQVCSNCGAFFNADCIDQAQSNIDMNNFCYHCGAKFIKYKLQE